MRHSVLFKGFYVIGMALFAASLAFAQQPPAQPPQPADAAAAQPRPAQPQLRPPVQNPAQQPAQAPGAAQPAAGGAGGGGLEKKIDGPFSVRNQDLQNVLTVLQQESGVSMVLGEGINKKVTFNLDSPTVRQVLDTVLPANGLGYASLDGGVVRIDTIDNIRNLQAVDVELMTRTFTPVYVDAAELEGALGQLKSPQGRIFIDNRSQKVVVEDTPEAIQAMEQLIQQFDVKMETRVFDLKYANAEEISEQLQGVLSAQEGKLLIDYRNNRLVITDTPARLDQAQAIIEQLDMELEYQVIPLAFALPEDVMPLIEGLLTENGFVDFDQRTSRIIIQDIPAVVAQVIKLIKQLDIPTQQVWVEADIVQISDSKSFTLGTEAAYGKDIGSGGNPSSPQVSSTTSSGFFSFNPFLTTGTNGLTLMDVRQGSYRFQIDAMVEKQMAEVIASPRLLIQDGEMGSFTLGSEEPYAARQMYGGYYGGGSSEGYYQQVRQVGTTIQLEVYASEAGFVEMFISVEDTQPRRVTLSNIGEGLAVDGSFIETAITVKSGRTVVLGGIINRSSSRSQNGVPVLSSIPVLGSLFKKKTSSDGKKKLLVFLTPRIVNISDPFDFAQVDNFQHLRDLQDKGANKLIDATKIDDKLLDWSTETQNEQKAIDEAMGKAKSGSTNGAKKNTSKKKPSKKEQLDQGIIQMNSEDAKE